MCDMYCVYIHMCVLCMNGVYISVCVHMHAMRKYMCIYGNEWCVWCAYICSVHIYIYIYVCSLCVDGVCGVSVFVQYVMYSALCDVCVFMDCVYMGSMYACTVCVKCIHV